MADPLNIKPPHLRQGGDRLRSVERPQSSIQLNSAEAAAEARRQANIELVKTRHARQLRCTCTLLKCAQCQPTGLSADGCTGVCARACRIAARDLVLGVIPTSRKERSPSLPRTRGGEQRPAQEATSSANAESLSSPNREPQSPSSPDMAVARHMSGAASPGAVKLLNKTDEWEDGDSGFLNLLRMLRLDDKYDVDMLRHAGIRSEEDLLGLDAVDLDDEDMKVMPLMTRKKLRQFVTSPLQEKKKIVSAAGASNHSQSSPRKPPSADVLVISPQTGGSSLGVLGNSRGFMEGEEEKRLAGQKVLLRMEKMEWRMEKLQQKMSVELDDLSSKMNKALDSLNLLLANEVKKRSD
jgi:hypothetical protein